MNWYYKNENWTSQQEYFANTNKKQKEDNDRKIRELSSKNDLEKKIIEYLKLQKVHLNVQQISKGVEVKDNEVLSVLNDSNIIKKSITPLDKDGHSVRYYVE